MTIVIGLYKSLNSDTYYITYLLQNIFDLRYLYLIFSVRVGIMLVKIDDTVTAQEYGVEDTPALVYFENEIPHLYEGMKYKKHR